MDIGLYENSPSAWIVVNTHPHRERLAIENLRRQEFQAYCPMILKRVRHARRCLDVPRPLFPGYLFVGVSHLALQWRPILSTRGVRNLVRFGDRLGFIDRRFIESLKQREIGGIVKKPDAPFLIGQEVRIAGGPFDGLLASIIELPENDRLVVLMEFLNGQVRVMVESENVTAA